MNKLALFFVCLSLNGCHMSYNNPDRFLGRLDPATLATIKPPLTDNHPDWPTLRGPDYGHSYQAPAHGPAYGTWSK